MKQQDIAIVIVIIFFAGIVSFVVSSKFITTGSKNLQAEVVTEISPSFTLPDDSVFNSAAKNPTVRIEIAPVTNPQPFTNKTN